jgi:fructose-bisphosphate aldolase class II
VKTNIQKILQFAYTKFAVGAFSVNTIEQILGVCRGATAAQAPVIFQVSHKARQYAGPNVLEAAIHAAVKSYPEMMFAVHLDHGDEADCHACIESGYYSSVMVDASHCPFEENIDITRRVVEHGHRLGICVEAELGRLSGKEDDISVDLKEAFLTDPRQAAEFVERTGCDSLAVAVGTSHGVNKFDGSQELHKARLAEIQDYLPGYPLVLHGASTVPRQELVRINAAGGELDLHARGVSAEEYVSAIGLGVAKINIDTDSRVTWMRVYREHLRDFPRNLDIREPGSVFVQEFAQLVESHCRTFGSWGKTPELRILLNQN